jgi:hypothetical protein
MQVKHSGGRMRGESRVFWPTKALFSCSAPLEDPVVARSYLKGGASWWEALAASVQGLRSDSLGLPLRWRP